MERSDPPSNAALPNEGDLSALPLPRLLVTLHRRGFDGKLVLLSGRHEKTFVWERGAPILAMSNLPSENLGAQLVDKGELDRADYERVCEYVQKKRCREGVAMLALELLKPKQLFLALKDQVRRRLVDCFGWPEGTYRLEPGDAQGGEAEAFRCDPVALVQEGLETHWAIERMIEDLTPRLELYPQPRKDFGRLIRRLRVDPPHESLFGGLDGSGALGVALGPAFGSPRTLAAVWVVDALDAVVYHDEPVATDEGPAHAFDSAIEISVADEDDTQAATRPAAGRGAAKGAADADAEQAAGMRAQIEKLRGGLDELDHYQLLGVESGASAGAIKKAYFKAAKQFHPDTLAKLGLEDVRDDASEVFARIAEAFEVLSDKQKRSDYDAALRGELGEADAIRLAQAETSYRKGEILLKMGDFAGALEYLGPAVEVWPEECAYQSALGWALFKQPKSETERARGHLEKAVEIDPNDALAHTRLSLVLRALGETAEAERVLDRARQLDPGNSNPGHPQ